MNVLLYISTFLHFFLGGYIIYSNKKNVLNITFGLFSIGIALWSLTNALFQVSANAQQMLIWALVAYTAATFMLISLTLFSLNISNKKISRLNKILLSSVTILSFLLPYIPGVTILGVDFDSKSIKGSTLLPLLFMTYLIFIFISLYNLFRSYLTEQATKKRQQLKYVSIGISLAIATGLTTNLILPAINNYSFVSLGPSFTILLLLFTSVSIFRYGFLEVRVLIGRILYYALLTIILIIGFYVSYFLDISLWGKVDNLQAIFTGIPVGFLFLLTYDYLRKSIQKNVTTKIINPGYDPSEEISTFNVIISTKLDSTEISRSLQNVLSTTIRPHLISIYSYSDKTQSENEMVDLVNNFSNKIDQITLNLFIDIWNKTSFKALNYDQLNIDLPIYYSNYASEVKRLLTIMEQYSIRLAVPILDPKNLIGILFLGEKESDYPYNYNQLDFIVNLTKITGVALGRSKLYEQVEKFNHSLKKEINLATQELQQKNVLLQEQLRKEKDMMDILGHELRTPLSIARNAVLMMKTAISQIKDDGTQQELNHLFEKATENIRREVKILETVLSSTRIENNRLQIVFEKVDLNDVVNDAIDGNKIEAEKKNLKFYSQLPNQTINVYAGRDQVQEIVDNLVSNAIKYTEKGEIKIILEKDNHFGIVTVVDTGEGIPESEIPNLGKKFYRINPYLKDQDEKMNIIRPGGTGIGLYVVFSLIKMMKGEISIKSKVGIGTAFTVKFPLTGYTEKEITPIKN